MPAILYITSTFPMVLLTYWLWLWTKPRHMISTPKHGNAIPSPATVRRSVSVRVLVSKSKGYPCRNRCSTPVSNRFWPKLYSFDEVVNVWATPLLLKGRRAWFWLMSTIVSFNATFISWGCGCQMATARTRTRRDRKSKYHWPEDGLTKAI